ncbi:MAG: choice-of-anchor L domain-containing protein [Pseudomonadota bacterium]
MSVRLAIVSGVSGLAITLGAFSAHAVQITETDDAALLADELFLNVDGLSVTSAIVSGDSAQFGTYTNESGIYGLPNNGIVLSTGNVSDYGDGPNTENGKSTSFSDFFNDEVIDIPEEEFEFIDGATPEQSALLDPITFNGNPGSDAHFDVAQLTIEFDAGPDIDSVTFFGVFGSEEFPDFVDSEFNDGFGLYVNGVNAAFAEDLPVNIDHPSFRPNPQPPLDGGGLPPIDVEGGEEFFVNFNVVEIEEIPFVETELNGVLAPGGNPVLRFDVPVIAGANNIFDIILADTGDDILDTTVYLSSFLPTDPPNPNDGSTEFTPLLPDSEEDGVFRFEIVDFDEGDLFFIDPPVAVGYDYSIENAEFATVMAPSNATIPDTDGYTIMVNGVSVDINPGETLTFSDVTGDPVTNFSLSGIDPSLLLDPNDPLAFPLGTTFQNVTGDVAIEQDPQEVEVGEVPLPAGLPLYLGALGLLWFVRRRITG